MNNFTMAIADYETTGINKDYSRIVQWAGVHTDADFNVIEGSEVNLLCKPPRDTVIEPVSFLIHGADIDEITEKGLTEYELALAVDKFYTKNPVTAMAGYNSLSFDDEFTRRLKYRSLMDPYGQEWKDGNFRLDVFKLVVMAHVFSPGSINWAHKDDGSVSLKLETLSQANGIEHANAHDALSDVLATAGLGKLLKDNNPAMWKHFLMLANKKLTKDILMAGETMVMASTSFGRDRNYSSIVKPIVVSPNNPNSFVAVDLSMDLDPLFNMSSEELRHNLFTKKVDLPENSPAIPLLSIANNKQEIIIAAEKYLLNSEFVERNGVDPRLVKENEKRIAMDRTLPLRAQKAFDGDMKIGKDRYTKIYTGGFQTREDQRHQERLHFVNDDGVINLLADPIADKLKDYADPARIFELSVRAKWNNFLPEILDKKHPSVMDPLELVYYAKHLNNMLYGKAEDGNLTIMAYHKELQGLNMTNPLSEEQAATIDKVTGHHERIRESAKKITALAVRPDILLAAKERLELLPEELASELQGWIERREASAELSYS
jgi:exodeoxyribonuclease-1